MISAQTIGHRRIPATNLYDQMSADTSRPVAAALLIWLVVYGAASLFHYAHNAEFLAEYPNMPAGLSRMAVYAAWLGVTTVGVIGYLVFRRGYRLAGLSVMAVYAALGFDGLGHYGLAPVSAHTPFMNLTIWLEAASAALLLVAVAVCLYRRFATPNGT
jgi:hypothetical protein